KFVEMHESPYHGLNFCIGTVSEMLENPGEEIYDIIRYFGERKKLFNIHFRNIKGGFLDFVEVFPDEGDVNMLQALRVLKAVDYPYMIMPDHVPGISGEAGGSVGFGYCFGYIHALMQAISEEA
ncbi:MAG: mannonate dehydratase, partial [Candidatus Poribacteria bacterium]|nr:mannonate dehydratase [Candidatus Poribacteria bacterium]